MRTGDAYVQFAVPSPTINIVRYFYESNGQYYNF